VKWRDEEGASIPLFCSWNAEGKGKRLRKILGRDGVEGPFREGDKVGGQKAVPETSKVYPRTWSHRCRRFWSRKKR
jgi:hypothetical protein